MVHDAEQQVVEKIESVIQEDVGRNVGALFSSARGGLYKAAKAFSPMSSPHIGLITGFFVPTGKPPAGETDGPLGAALLASGFRKIGIPCRLATDEPCRGACRAALIGAGIDDVPLDVVAVNTDVTGLISTWHLEGITHVISIERCGRSIDGTPRNLRGVDIGSYTMLLDDLFLGGPWLKIAIGDGGNEIGMGSIPRHLISKHVKFGELIACVTPADHLIVAGVSNWGAYGLLGALAAVHIEWRANLWSCLDAVLDQRILETMVFDGPSVDGITGQRVLTVDGLELAKHHEKLYMIRELVRL